MAAANHHSSRRVLCGVGGTKTSPEVFGNLTLGFWDVALILEPAKMRLALLLVFVAACPAVGAVDAVDVTIDLSVALANRSTGLTSVTIDVCALKQRQAHS